MASNIHRPTTRQAGDQMAHEGESQQAQGESHEHQVESQQSQGESHQYQAGNTTHREIDAWKHRPPYAIHEASDNFKTVWNGKCHCGKVTYQLSRDKPLASKYCHCTTCQRLHGAPFQWAAIFHKTDINFTRGHHDLGWYDPSAKSVTHHLPCKVSCAYCRTPIMDEGRNMILLFPGLIEEIATERGRSAFRVGCHMFYNQRVVDFIDDGVTKFEGLDGLSNRLDDHGKVIDRYDPDQRKFESDLHRRGGGPREDR